MLKKNAKNDDEVMLVKVNYLMTNVKAFSCLGILNTFGTEAE